MGMGTLSPYMEVEAVDRESITVSSSHRHPRGSRLQGGYIPRYSKA